MILKQKFFDFLQKIWFKRYQPLATMPEHTVHCPECGEANVLPKLRQGQQANCHCCNHILIQIESEPYLMPFAMALSALLLMAIVYSQELMNVQMAGVRVALNLWTMATHLIQHQWGFLGIVMAILVFGTPILFCTLVIYVYYCLLFNQYSVFLLNACRLMTRLRPWIMVDVFFISILVAYIKISSLADIHFGVAFWLMPILFICILRTSLAVSDHWLYFQIRKFRNILLQQPQPSYLCCTRCLHFNVRNKASCQICGSELFERRPSSLKLSSYFLLAASILYIPANFLPIMITANPMEEEVSTIMSGIILMWEDEPFIASIIFSASILVPSLKIISLAVLLYSAKFRLLFSIRFLSVQYKITEAIGRWSMIDIFVIIILMSTFYTPLARVEAGIAAIYFCLVVVTTMISSHFFDARLLWDKHRKQENTDMLPENKHFSGSMNHHS